MGNIINAGTLSLPYFSVVTLVLLLLKAMEPRLPLPQDNRFGVAQQEQEPIMQSIRFDERPNAADLALGGNYSAARRLTREPSLCGYCRCVHLRPANFRMLLYRMTESHRNAADAAVLSPPVQRGQQQIQQMQEQGQQQMQEQERITVWKSFKKALAKFRSRIQRFLNLPQRRQ